MEHKKYKGTLILDWSHTGCCFLEKASSKQANDNRSLPSQFQWDLDQAPAAVPTAPHHAFSPSAGQTTGSQTVHAMTK